MSGRNEARQAKSILTLAPTAGPEDLPGELLEILLAEAERALLLVDARLDEPGHRKLDGAAPEDVAAGTDVAGLSLAIAVLVDSNQALQIDLERVAERYRTAGAAAAAASLATHHELLEVVRLSLEALFRVCPTVASYVARVIETDPPEENLRSPEDTYGALRDALAMLRRRLH